MANLLQLKYEIKKLEVTTAVFEFNRRTSKWGKICFLPSTSCAVPRVTGGGGDGKPPSTEI
jgi:hypothetical protein